jgi:hypothetical protein
MAQRANAPRLVRDTDNPLIIAIEATLRSGSGQAPRASADLEQPPGDSELPRGVRGRAAPRCKATQSMAQRSVLRQRTTTQARTRKLPWPQRLRPSEQASARSRDRRAEPGSCARCGRDRTSRSAPLSLAAGGARRSIFSGLRPISIKYHSRFRKWTQFLDFETAHELFKVTFCLLVTAPEYEAAINSFQFDHRLAVRIGRILGDPSIADLAHNRFPLVLVGTVGTVGSKPALRVARLVRASGCLRSSVRE